jgi:glyoxylase I family protein
MRPTFLGVMYVGLSVRDLARSATWYRDVLGLDVERQNIGGSAWSSDWDEVLLRHPDSGLLIGLLQHPANPGDAFSEFRTGLDHLELEVASQDELDAWRRRLDSLGVSHSGAHPHIGNRSSTLDPPGTTWH